MSTDRPTALVLTHVDFEDLGVLEGELQRRAFHTQRVEAPTADWRRLADEQPALLIVLGGPLGVVDLPAYPFLQQELAFIERCLRAKVPVLGVCLGAQLIAHALGAKVEPMGVREIGFGPLDLTEEVASSPLAALAGVPVLHWHGDRFEIPASARRLAATPVCDNQAFAIGTQVLALQFHMEVDTVHVERWLVGNATELAGAGIDPRDLREQALEHGPRMAAAARVAFGRWLDAAFAAQALPA